MRTTILLFYCLFSGMISSAQPLSENEQTQVFIHYIDPFGLVIIEVIEPGMTFYNLKTRYNIGIDKLFEANPDLDPSAIPLGYPIQIPVYPEAISFSPPEAGEDSIPIFYRVQPKETLYRISKVYLGVSPEKLIRLNPRIEEGLAIGQVIHLGWYNPNKQVSISTELMPKTTASPALLALPMDSTNYIKANASTVVPSDSSSIRLKDSAAIFHVTDFAVQYVSEGKTIIEQKGLAVWKPGSSQSNYYVLHPTAMVGSYMEITNPMLHRTLTAKVAGNIASGLYPPQVGLVVSPSVARALGILDQQFFASWRFVE